MKIQVEIHCSYIYSARLGLIFCTKGIFVGRINVFFTTFEEICRLSDVISMSALIGGFPTVRTSFKNVLFHKVRQNSCMDFKVFFHC